MYFTYAWDTESWSKGSHTLQATVYDSVNSVANATINVTIDRALPQITNTKIIRNGTNAIVTWQTGKPCNSRVEYGTTSSLGLVSPVDETMTNDHKVVVSLPVNNGVTGQTYYFCPVSQDQTGNTVRGDISSKLLKMYIGSWLFNGNYSGTDLNIDYLGGESAVSPQEGDVTGGKMWAKVDTEAEGSINFAAVMGPNIGFSNYDNTLIYAYTNIYSPSNQNVDLKLGIDNQAKVWLNGNLVSTVNSTNSYTVNNLTLNNGWNRLLVKARNTGSTFSFSVAFTVPGQASIPANGLIFQTADPAEGMNVPDRTGPFIRPSVDVDVSNNAVVSWQTSESANACLNHGPTADLGTLVSDTTSAVNHVTSINGLGANANYFLQFSATDPKGNTSSRMINYPLIYDEVCLPTANTVTVRWATGSPADSQLEWGTTTSLGQKATPEPEMVSEHQMVITGLNVNTVYYIRIKSGSAEGNFSKVIKVKTKSTYIRDWLVNGLYSYSDNTELLNRDFLNGETSVRPAERNTDGDYTWAKLINSSDYIDLNEVYLGRSGENDNKVVYAHTFFYSPASQSVYLSMGSNDGLKAWLNGNLVWTNDVTRGHTLDQDKVSVNIEPCWNRLLIKVKNNTSTYAFSARFLDAANNPVDFLCRLDDPLLNSVTPDRTCPGIVNRTETVLSNNKVRIQWRQDEAGTAVLEWGKDTLSSTMTNSTLRVGHSYDIGPLEPYTTYSYRIKSTDYYGNTVTSDVYSFTTLAGTAGCIKNWLINGPYVDDNAATRLFTDYLGAESIVRPSTGEGTILCGKAWEKYTAPGDLVDFSGQGLNPANVMYAHTFFKLPYNYSVTRYISLGNCGGISVWVNGINVFTKEQPTDQFVYDQIPISILPGTNQLLVKCFAGSAQFGFSARITDAGGNKIDLSTWPSYLVETGNPAATLVNEEWMAAFEAENKAGEQGIYLRNSYGWCSSWYPSLAVISNAVEPAVINLGSAKALSYLKSDGTNQQVKLRITQNDGTTWSEELSLTNRNVSVFQQKAVVADNRAYIFYSYNDGSLYYRTSSDLQNWEEEVLVGRKVGVKNSKTYPYFSVIQTWDHKWALCWLDVTQQEPLPGIANNLGYPAGWFALSNDLQNWQEAKEVIPAWASTFGNRWPEDMSLEEDMSGNLVLAYCQYRYPWDKYIYYRWSADQGASWSNRRPVSIPQNGPPDGWQNYSATYPYLTNDTFGNVVVFYSEDDYNTGEPLHFTCSYIPRAYEGPIEPGNAFGYTNFSGEAGFGVNPAIGNYNYQNEDLKITGKGLPLDLTRSYNSGAAATDGTFGCGWTHNYNVSLTVGENGIVRVSTEDGRVDTYILGADNTYTPFPGVFDKLIHNDDGSWLLQRTNKNTLYFNAGGVLTKITDKNGNTTTLTYSNNLLTQVTDAGGRQLTITYQNGHISNITDPAGRQYAYTYADGNLTSYTDPEGGVISYSYDSSHHLSEVTDARGHRAVKVYYDANGKVTQQEDAKGNLTAFAYGADGRSTTVTEGVKVTTLKFDGYYRLISQTDGLGYETKYTYDGLGNRTSVTNANGKKTLYGYDLNGNLTRVTDPLGKITANQYNAGGDLVARIDAKGNKTTFEYDSKGNLLKTNLPDGSNITTTYNSSGLPLTITDPKGNITTYTYDNNGYPLTQTDALGHTTTSTYDNVGHKLSVTDAGQKTTVFTYDANDNLLTVTDPLNHVTTSEYDPNGNKLRETNPLNQATVNTYDEINQLVTVTDALGRQTNFEYDAAGNRTKVIDALGKQTVYVYDANDRLISTTDANGNQTTFTYDGNGNKLTETDAQGQTTHYTYNALDRLLSVTDPLDHTVSYQYDAAGNLIKEQDALEQETLYAYNSLNRVISRTDPAGRATRWEYDGNGNKIKEIDAANNSTVYEYDAANRLTRKTNPLNQATVYEYDANNRLLRTIEPGNAASENNYDAAGNIIKTIDPRGNETTYEYNALGKVTAVTDATGHTLQLAYDALGRVTGKTDWRGNTTTYEYDALGRKTSVTEAGANPCYFTYDPVGSLLTESDAKGQVTAYQYDSLKQVITKTDALSGQTRYTYDAAGNVLTATDALGHIVAYTYDALNRLHTKILPGNKVTTQTYDQAGNLETVTDANGNTTAYTYDELNRVICVTDALGNSTLSTYDAVGNRTQLTDAKGKTTVYLYDERNRLQSVTDPLQHTTGYSYDANNNLLQITDARGNITTYEYDELDRTTKVTDPLNRAKSFTYDANGNKAGETDAGNQTTQYVYDPQNRLQQVNRSNGQNITYTYDQAGNRTSMTDPSGATNYEYDALNRPVKISYQRNSLDVNYSYDGDGKRTLMTVTRNSQVLSSVQYNYNELDQLVQLKDKENRTFTFSYDDTGNVTRVNYPNGTQAVFTYDAANRVTAIDNSRTAGGSLRSYQYTYDENGRRTRMVTDGTDITDYVYDNQGQLTRLSDQRGQFDFVYDEAGNRTRMVKTTGEGSAYIDYLYDAANELLAAGSLTFAYDANGNRISKTGPEGTVTYQYDFNNMLTGITTPTARVSYVYDGDKRKVARTSTVSGSSYYLFDGNTAIMEGPTADLNNATCYLEGIGGLLAKITPEGIVACYYHDALGNTRAMADGLGNLTDTYGYDAWGAVMEHSGSGNEKYAFVGKYGVSAEADDGLLMMGLRFYDPLTGVFLQKDPFPGYLEDPTLLHPYMYTRNDPVNRIDPTGESWLSDGLDWLKESLAPAGRWVNQQIEYATQKAAEVGRAVITGAKPYGQYAVNTYRKAKEGIATFQKKVEKKVTEGAQLKRSNARL